MDGITWPVTLVQLVSVPGLAILASLAALWYKRYLADSRWVPLLILFTTEAVGIVAQVLYKGEALALADVFVALILAFVASSLAVYGYETILNSLGMAGIGPRADS